MRELEKKKIDLIEEKKYLLENLETDMTDLLSNYLDNDSYLNTDVNQIDMFIEVDIDYDFLDNTLRKFTVNVYLKNKTDNNHFPILYKDDKIGLKTIGFGFLTPEDDEDILFLREYIMKANIFDSYTDFKHKFKAILNSHLDSYIELVRDIRDISREIRKVDEFIVFVDGVKSVVTTQEPMTREHMLNELKKENVYSMICDVYPYGE